MWNEWVRWFSIWSCLSKRLLAALRRLMFANGCLKIPIVMCSSLELPGIGEESPVMLSDFVKILSRLMFLLRELSRMSFRCDANLSLMSCRSSTVEFKKGRFSFSNGVRVPLSSFQLVRVSVKRLKNTITRLQPTSISLDFWMSSCGGGKRQFWDTWSCILKIDCSTNNLAACV